MLRTSIAGLVIGLVLLNPSGLGAAGNDPVFFQISTGQTISEDAFVQGLAPHRVVLVGEQHNQPHHHEGQLRVIRLMAARSLPLAIGMEMMRHDSQAQLDAWIAGKMDEKAFRAVYRDNWNYPWPLYRSIFIFAREHKIPIIGLNVPRAITRQVAREGFDSLTPSQRQGLPFITCSVDEDYRAYIRQAYGAHGHGDMTFDHFCEAQLVWDKAMAVNALRYLEKEPDRQMVILAGTGHVRKNAIPLQIETYGDLTSIVVLPEIPSFLDARNLDVDDADFLLQNLSPEKN